MSSRFYDMSYPQYTVHDVSALTGLTPQTIRYYDSIGVVVPQRGAQGQRLYSYYDVLNLVRRSLYKAQGFSLQETEQVLSGAITPRLGALLEEKRADIEEKQRALRLAQLNLDRLSAQLDRLGVCRGRVMYLERPACWHVPYSRDEILLRGKVVQRPERLAAKEVHTRRFDHGVQAVPRRDKHRARQIREPQLLGKR